MKMNEEPEIEQQIRHETVAPDRVATDIATQGLDDRPYGDSMDS